MTFFLLISFLMFTCKATQKIDQEQNTAPSFEYDANKNQILFFNLTIKRPNKDSQAKIELVNTIVSEGKIKRDYPQKTEYRPMHLLCSFLDENQVIIKQTTIKNPLHRRYEFENEEGQMESKIVESNEGQISLRTQLTEGIRFLRVDEIDSNSQLILLQYLKLQ